MADNIKPTVQNVRGLGMLADRRAYRADVRYADGRGYVEDRTVAFTGPAMGGIGPVVMITDLGTQSVVDDPGRFGVFGDSWVRAFYES